MVTKVAAKKQTPTSPQNQYVAPKVTTPQNQSYTPAPAAASSDYWSLCADSPQRVRKGYGSSYNSWWDCSANWVYYFGFGARDTGWDNGECVPEPQCK
jgi:hypothetical protein